MIDAGRKRYAELLDSIAHVPLYANTWWLDATSGEHGWKVLSWKNLNSDDETFMPYQAARIRGLNAVVTPPLTQFLPVLPAAHEEQFLFDSLMGALPPVSILDISIRPSDAGAYKEIFPHVQLRYSYVIHAMQSLEQIRLKYNEGLRRNLREAEKKYVISESEDVDGFLRLCMMTYQQRQMKAPGWLTEVVPDVYKALRKNAAGVIKIASQDGKPISGVMIAWDNDMSYYLTGGRMETENGASAHALLLDDAIRDAAEKNIKFDFEGSMHPGIANFFQSFGGVPERFWRIRKFKGLGKIWGMMQN